jgi:hypothetical protein
MGSWLRRLTHNVFFSASLFGRRERLLLSSGTWTSVEEMGPPGTLREESPTLGPLCYHRPSRCDRDRCRFVDRCVCFVGTIPTRADSSRLSKRSSVEEDRRLVAQLTFTRARLLKESQSRFFGERSEMKLHTLF